MSNNYYTPSGSPATSAKAVSATQRAEFASIEDGFDKISPLTGNGDLPVFVNTGGTAQETKSLAAARTLLNVEDGADVTDAVNIASSIAGATAKATPIDADSIGIIDSAASSALKETTFAQIKAFLKTYFDTLYNKYVHPNHSGDVTSVAVGAQTIANKQTMSATAPITLSNTPTVIAAAAPVIAIPAATASVDGYATSTQITKLDTIEESAVALATVKADTDIADALTKKHANTSDHTQGTDTALGTVGTKNPPIDADLAIYRDSAASNVLVTSTWTQIKAFLKTYFDTIYNKYVLEAHKTNHQNGGADEISVSGLSGVLANDQHVIDAEVQAISINNVVEDTSPELGGELDCGAHTIGFTQQTVTYNGTTTTVDWKLGNKATMTFGAGNIGTFAFTNPTNPCNVLLKIIQDGTGSRVVTAWDSDIKWPSGTAPTLSTSGGSVDIIAAYFDGSYYYAQASLDFS